MSRIGVTVISVPFTEDGFDAEALEAFCTRHEVVGWRDHFFLCGGQPHLVVLLEHVRRERVTDGPARGGGHGQRRGKRREEDPRKDLAPADRPLFEQLREWRALRASRDGVPLYVILNNSQLAEIARRKPSSQAGLRAIEGIGAAKVEKYAAEVIALLSSAAAEQGGGDGRPGS